MRLFMMVSALFIVFFVIGTVSAQSTPSSSRPDRIEQLQQQVADAKSSADNAWMLASSALVLMMTGPGLALFYGGLVRRKNVLSTMMHSFSMMAIITVLWSDVLGSFIIDFGSSPFRCGPVVLSGQTQDLPVPIRRACVHVRVSDNAEPRR